MQRQDIIEKLKTARSVDTSKRIMVKELDYSSNPLSPCTTAYRVYYTDVFGSKRVSTYYNDAIGFQG